MSNHIIPPKNVSGEVKFVSDPTRQPTGQNVIIEYTYRIKYRDNNINATDIPFDSQPKNIQDRIIQNLLRQGIDIENRRRNIAAEISSNIESAQYDSITATEESLYNKTSGVAFDTGTKPIYVFLTDEEIEQYLNPSTSSQNITGITFEIIVENNAGLPNYTYTDNRFIRGKEELALSIVQDHFSGNDGLNPPTMTVPSADIYTIDPETNEILIDQDWYEQQYPPEGAEVEFIGGLEPVPYTFSSILVDGITNKPISFAKIEDLDGNFSYTDAQGNFTIEGQFIPGEIQELVVTSNSVNPVYEVLTVPITTQGGSLRNDINFVPLYPTNVDTDAAILKTKSTPDSVKSNLEEDKKRDFIASTVKRAVDEIQNRLYPFIINKLLTEPFGIGDPIKLIKQAQDLSKVKKRKLTRNERRAKRWREKIDKRYVEGNTTELELIDGTTGEINTGVRYKDNTDLALFIRSLEPGESFIDANGDMYTVDEKGRIISGSGYQFLTWDKEREIAVDQTPDGYVQDFTFAYDDTEPSLDDLDIPRTPSPGDTPIVEDIPDEDEDKKIKKKKTKNKNKGKKYKVRYPKPKGTILKKGGKFRSRGNRRSRNKRINFSGRRRY